MWLIEEDHRNHPYLLDWYYASRPRPASDHTIDIPVATQQPGEYWMPPDATESEQKDEGYQGQDSGDRLQSQFGASTSTAFFHGNVFQLPELNNRFQPAASNWWARSGPGDGQPETSFLEPPNFFRYTSNIYNDNVSDRGSEDQEQSFHYRSNRLSWTTYMEESESGGDVNLYFDEIYSGPPEAPSASLELPKL